MALDPATLSQEVLDFLGERHLGTLTTLRADGSPHVVAVGFTFDAAAPRGADHHLRPVAEGPQRPRGGRAAVCQVDGGRWLTLEGEVRLVEDPAGVAKAVNAYAARYRQPGERADRVAIEIAVDKVLGRA